MFQPLRCPKYYNFAIFSTYFAKPKMKQAVNIDLQCILCIANSGYTVKTPKYELTCNTYWNFYKKLKIWKCFPQNGRF